jgi:hypothetical protein
MRKIADFVGSYKTQRDNTKLYFINEKNVVDFNGKILFPVEDLDKREGELFDRTTQCFISSGSMFTESLWKGGVLTSPLDETAYHLLIISNLKNKQTRFMWDSHKQVLNRILAKSQLEFHYRNSKGREEDIKDCIDFGFVVIASIWIQPWYLSGRGHLVVIKGYILDEKGKIEAFILDDPFGNVLTKYKDTNGESVIIPIDEWKKLVNSPIDKPRQFGFIQLKKGN